MNKERAQILRMLDEGKITAEEANQLLLAFKKAGASRAEEWKSQERWSFFDWIASLFGAGDSFSEELDWTLDGAEVSSISARTDNGSISLGGSDREQVTVRARKKVRAPTEAAAKEFARQVQIHVERNGNEVHIYKEHPRPPLGTSVCVSYEISSPRDVDADLCTSNGAIRIHEVDGEIEAVTSNGAIECRGEQVQSTSALPTAGSNCKTRRGTFTPTHRVARSRHRSASWKRESFQRPTGA